MEAIKMRRIRQVFEKKRIGSIPEKISQEFERINLSQKIRPGMQIGVTVGSRGINNIQLIIKSIVEEVKKRKGVPFILPAMGSHGGATAQGQNKVLANYGITEESMGVPIKSSMDVVELGCLENGLPVYFDRFAFEADGIIVVNRVKVHTAFKSSIESGLHKMVSVGLGNHQGATLVHQLGVKGLKDYMVEFAKVILQKAPIICGLGVLENAYDEICALTACMPGDFQKVDKELLKECKRMLPVLPVSELDIFIVKEMGKNISGTGMDTNVVGGIKGYTDGEYIPPEIKRIIVLDLTKETQGNALGIGLADLTTRKVYEKINLNATYSNTITTTFLDRAKIPIVCNTEEEAFNTAMRTIWNLPDANPRIIVIQNTLKLDQLYVSESIWEEIRSRKNIKALGDWERLSFDSHGNLLLEF